MAPQHAPPPLIGIGYFALLSLAASDTINRLSSMGQKKGPASKRFPPRRPPSLPSLPLLPMLQQSPTGDCHPIMMITRTSWSVWPLIPPRNGEPYSQVVPMRSSCGTALRLGAKSGEAARPRLACKGGTQQLLDRAGLFGSTLFGVRTAHLSRPPQNFPPRTSRLRYVYVCTLGREEEEEEEGGLKPI